ncbi:MAG: DUF2577 domain-containing protein [Negativicutes bacterium]|nr:DUF2577 domain-containing protein [Negativicutes bacterium]
MTMDLNPNGSLYELMKTIMQNVVGNMGMTDIAIGTVETINPLSIRINPYILLPANVLILTETVCYKKVLLYHTHSDPQGGNESEELGDRTVNTAAGDNPPDAEYTIINRDLLVGDRVVMLRVLGGQQFIVLSKVVNE